MRRAPSAGSDGQTALPFADADSGSTARATSPSQGLVRHRDPLRARLEALEKEHRRLLSAIGRKKERLATNEAAAERAGAALREQLAELRGQATQLSHQIRALFDNFLNRPKSKLKPRQRRQIQTLLRGLEEDMLLPAGDESLSDVFESGGYFDEDGEFIDDPFGADSEAGAAGLPAGGYSAPKPDGNKQAALKALFRKLALKLHPDHAANEEERERRTELFQEVTRAYECGDVARLLEIEQRWGLATALEAEAHLEARSAHLTQANSELRRQLRQLQKEDREVQDCTAGAVSEAGEFEPKPEVEQALDELKQHLASLQLIHGHCVAYDTGKLSFEAFLVGPTPTDPDADALSPELEELLAGLTAGQRRALDDLLDQVAHAVQAGDDILGFHAPNSRKAGANQPKKKTKAKSSPRKGSQQGPHGGGRR